MNEIGTPKTVQFPYPVLIGDIGGTNARFAILTDSHSDPVYFENLATSEFETPIEAIQIGIMGKSELRPKTAILAIAAPIDGDQIPMTNNHWIIEPKKLIDTFGLDEIILLNDFDAQALSLSVLQTSDIEPLTHKPTDPLGTKIILGPGTGLGVAALVNSGETWSVVSGEGGHIDLAPITQRDFEYWPHLETAKGRISAEQIVCGKGMINLYNALCLTDGVAAQYQTPAEISQAALHKNDPIAQETLELFTIHLGRVAGNLALIFMATGGVYISGGISQKIIDILKNGSLMSAFSNKSPHKKLLSNMPVSIIKHPLAPLLGLAAYAQAPEKFGLRINHRQWLKR